MACVGLVLRLKTKITVLHSEVQSAVRDKPDQMKREELREGGRKQDTDTNCPQSVRFVQSHGDKGWHI